MIDITEKETEVMAEHLVEELLERDVRRTQFTEARQDQIMGLLIDYLKQHRHLDSDDLYDTENKPVAIEPEDFHFLVDNMMDVAKRTNKIDTDENIFFPNKLCYLKHDVNLIFFVMWGQGTCVQVYISDEDWRESSAITYEQVKAFLSSYDPQ
ncbi:hypothetical protein JOD82_001930 [Paenibacillus sp. 1182]|uniref:hypothetical protein n=1 Tax=Paenibacillus sp. 1182 TaxID=2806565 RepID=UPI001AE42D20|nr:hypothetical protein [Paenibacillus sp. 1182]MBP1308910.1 hypothetical protein [Paenibacillus sp. 1182]